VSYNNEEIRSSVQTTYVCGFEVSLLSGAGGKQNRAWVSGDSRQAWTGLLQAAFRTLSSISFPTTSIAFFLDLLFHPEYAGGRFLRNVGFPSNYTALQTNVFDVISSNIKYVKFEIMSVVNMLRRNW
jgi:hypothetical protein